jgi:hypothetical protein
MNQQVVKIRFQSLLIFESDMLVYGYGTSKQKKIESEKCIK